MLTIGANCWLCQQPLYHYHHGICCYCQRHLPAPPVCCPRCGLPSGTATLPCGRCLYRPPRWHSLTFVSDYRPPFTTLLKQFKFHGRIELGQVLARQMLLRWLNVYRLDPERVEKPDVLLTVPLHRRQRWRRGFNQTELLAQPLARWLRCRYHPHTLSRVRHTPLQQHLCASERRYNLRHAFACDQDLSGLRVALVDDVVTTGNTVTEICRVLQAQGAAYIQVWCLCRTLLDA
ncbi:DNA utilization protein GntX [Symbiopectobacterium sp.]|uniref:DNA utilization protein GntX n=1 Tax=Symbiopectobacterium sp. TaxID=2952789 RepID=UPI003F3902DE